MMAKSEERERNALLFVVLFFSFFSCRREHALSQLRSERWRKGRKTTGSVHKSLENSSSLSLSLSLFLLYLHRSQAERQVRISSLKHLLLGDLEVEFVCLEEKERENESESKEKKRKQRQNQTVLARPISLLLSCSSKPLVSSACRLSLPRLLTHRLR